MGRSTLRGQDGLLGAVAAGDNVRAPHASCRADELRLKLRNPDPVRPSVDVLGCKLDVVATDRIRHRLRELAADQHRVTSAPYPSGHAKARARAIIEQFAERGAPDLSALVEADHPDIGWPMIMQRLPLAGIVGASGDRLVGHAMGDQIDHLTLLAAIFKPALIAYVEACV